MEERKNDADTTNACCPRRDPEVPLRIYNLSCCLGPETMLAYVAFKKKVVAAGGLLPYIKARFGIK